MFTQRQQVIVSQTAVVEMLWFYLVQKDHRVFAIEMINKPKVHTSTFIRKHRLMFKCVSMHILNVPILVWTLKTQIQIHHVQLGDKYN